MGFFGPCAVCGSVFRIQTDMCWSKEIHYVAAFMGPLSYQRRPRMVPMGTEGCFEYA